MPYQILEHTADFRLRVWGKNKKEFFEEAAYALLEVMQPKEKKQNLVSVKRKLKIRSRDVTELLVDFLNSILTRTQTNKETYVKVDILYLDNTNLEAELGAVKVKEFKKDIKAVTYHQAEVKRNQKGEWETLLVLDI